MPRSTSSTPMAPSGTATPQPAIRPEMSASNMPSVQDRLLWTYLVLSPRAALALATDGFRCDNRGMDALDREILGELVRDARLSYRDLGARVGLSANAAADRVRRLRRDGVITGFTATVDPGAAGRRLHALIEVNMGAEHPNDSFEAAVSRLEAVIDADHVTG